MKARFISYLDLMCCGFGGAVLLFLITASADPERTPTNDLIFVRCRHEATSGNPRAEIAIQYLEPGSTEWKNPTPGKPTSPNVIPAFAAISQPDGGSEAVLVLRAPRSGTWQFRAYLVNYPVPKKDAIPDLQPRPSTLRFEIKHRRTASGGDTFPAFDLIRPGQSGPPVSFRLTNG